MLARFEDVDVVCNNAGVCLTGTFAGTSVEDFRSQMDVVRRCQGLGLKFQLDAHQYPQMPFRIPSRSSATPFTSPHKYLCQRKGRDLSNHCFLLPRRISLVRWR